MDIKKLKELLEDPYWRLNNLYWIRPEGGGKIKFRMNAVQIKFYREMWWCNEALKSRQHGLSTLINLIQLDECLFNSNRTCGIIDKTDQDAQKKLGNMRFAYDHLDCADDGSVTAELGAVIKSSRPLVAPTNTHELTFGNRSRIWSGVSLRGGTVQNLHISELGPIAAKNPLKAEEIRSGSLNTIHKGCKVTIESTHEGGRGGLHYEMICLARKSPPREYMTEMDWAFHFFAWFEDPKNSLPLTRLGLNLPPELVEYFKSLKDEHGIELSDEQKHWYWKKYETQGEAMYREHPSTVDEALSAAIKGAIYGPVIAKLRKNRRVIDFEHDQDSPIYTFWDLGMSDYTSIWCIQFTGREFLVLDYYSNHGHGGRHYAEKVSEWEEKYGFISTHYLPHDASRHAGPGLTWVQELTRCGLKNLKVVPVTPDIWIGINHLRSLLPRCWIHATNCARELKVDDKRIIPSGLACLEGYKTKTLDQTNTIVEKPVHDEFSHGCDSLRVMAEAHLRGMLGGNSPIEKESRRESTRVITGANGRTESRRLTLRRSPRVLR